MKKIHLSLLIFFLSFPLFSQTQDQSEDLEEIQLSEIITYINNEKPAVEQREVITSEEIDVANTPNLPALLESNGIQLLSYGPYGLEQKPSIRGFTDETVRVVIDGVCVNNAQYGTFDFSSLNLDDIERVEIVRGGFTEGVCDEDAVAGAIYITTKRQEFGTHFRSDSVIKSYFNPAFPLDTFGQSLGFNTQFGNSYIKLNAQGTFAKNEFPYKDRVKTTKYREHADVIDSNANANYLHYFKNGSSFGVTDIFYIGNKNTPGSASAKQTGNLKDLDNNLSFQYINPEVLNAFKLESNLAWLSNNRLYDDSFGHSEHYVNSFRYNLTQDVYKFRLFKQSFGLNFDYTSLNSTDDGVHNVFSGTFKSTSKWFVPFGGNSVDQNQWNLSIPWAVKFSDKKFAFTPKLGTGFQFQKIDLFFDVYKMTQFPTMDDLYWDDGVYKGNPDLVPESGVGGDFTVSTKNMWLPLSLCIFSNYYMNKIQWAGNSPQNVASAFYLGCDLKLEKSFFKNNLKINSSSEYLYTRLMDKNNTVTYGKKIMWTPDLVSNLSFYYSPSENINLLLDLNYVGKRYRTNLNVSYLKPYVLMNASAQIKIHSNLKDGNLIFVPYLRGDNLLNWKYVSVDDYPMPGISLTIGLKVQF